MSEFRVSIDTNNAAFDGDRGYEIARILRHAAETVEGYRSVDMKIRDLNGNTVGQYGYTEED